MYYIISFDNGSIHYLDMDSECLHCIYILLFTCYLPFRDWSVGLYIYVDVTVIVVYCCLPAYAEELWGLVGSRRYGIHVIWLLVRGPINEYFMPDFLISEVNKVILN